MKEHKIVVLGTMGAGKSTLVSTLSDGKHVSTDVANTDGRLEKAWTTVALDYADIDLPNGDRLRLYGTPGQARFSFIWPILLEGASGAIVLVDAASKNPAEEVRIYLNTLDMHVSGIPTVIALTRLDVATLEQINGCDRWLMKNPTGRPLVHLDPRDQDQVLLVMDVLMSEIEASELVGAV